MKPEFDPQLESLLGAQLKRLPPIPAPASLLPKVMSAIAARAAVPWWQRAWWDWPLTAKAAFLLMAVAIAGAFSGGGVALDDGVSHYSQQVTERLGPVKSVWDAVVTLLNVTWSLVDRIGQPLLLHAAFGIGLLYLTCLGLGTVCVRYALKRA
jgi:hypothetical protein